MTTYVLMAGLPGTGKSTIADALAKDLGGVVLNKDTIRAALFPGVLTDYTREQDDLCFEMLLQAAQYLATHGRTGFVFLDGRTFSRAEQIDRAIHSAKCAGSEWKLLHVVCADEIAESRITREAAEHPAANRTVEMYREIKARFEPIVHPHLKIDSGMPLEHSVRQAVGYLLHRDGRSFPLE